MKIGLWSDNHNFPSLPLMKLSAYHKQLGDQVEMLNHLVHYDKVYASKTFSFTPDLDEMCMVYADEIQRGGTGYCISLENGREVFDKAKDQPLPKEIESIYPDYWLYPEYDFAVGFLTRGCPRGCGFCVVGKKEGLCSHQVADLSSFWRGQKLIELLDPNLLACADHEKLLQELINSSAMVNFNQGLDIRLITKDNIVLLNQVKTKSIHFAWDHPKQDLTKHFQFYAEHGAIKDHRRLIAYVLTNFGSTQEEDLHRIYTLRDLGFDPYVQLYDKKHASREKKAVARWVNNKWIFSQCERFEQYAGVR